MKYTPDEVAKLLANRPNQPHYVKTLIEKCVKAAVFAERERIAAEFDRRAVYSDGTPSSGWYEPHEPAEIVRGMK